MHRLNNAILIIDTRPLNRHSPHGGIIPPTADDISIEAAIRMGQLDIALADALITPAAITGDALLGLAADVSVVVEVVGGAAAGGGDDLVSGAEVEAVGGVRAGGGFEGAEAEDAGDEGPEVRDVGDDDGGGGLARVPVEVDEGAVARGEVVVAVQDGAEDDEGAEGEDAEEDQFSGGRGRGLVGWMEGWGWVGVRTF